MDHHASLASWYFFVHWDDLGLICLLHGANCVFCFGAMQITSGVSMSGVLPTLRPECQ